MTTLKSSISPASAKFKLHAAVMLFALLTGSTAYANPECGPSDAEQAESGTDTLETWEQIYELFERFSACDDGALAEGYSDKIAELLSHHWNATSNLEALAQSHPEFREFVLRHVDSLMSPDQAKAIDKNARLHCPPNAQDLCTALQAKIENRIKMQ